MRPVPGAKDAIEQLKRYAAPRRIAQLAPPVADRIELDPSIAEPPRLPAAERPTLHAPLDVWDSGAETGPELPGTKRGHSGKDSERHAGGPVCWPYPTSLAHQLEALRGEGPWGQWAEQVLEELGGLSRTDSLAAVEAGEHLERLRELSEQAPDIADSAPLLLHAPVLRANYGLTRRLAIWDQVHRIVSRPGEPTLVAARPGPSLSGRLTAVESELGRLARARQWRDYLLLDAAWAVADGQMDADQRRRLARRVLARMESPYLSARQHAFLKQPPLTSLAEELRRWASEPVDYRKLLEALEAYEQTHVAEPVAAYCELLRWSAGQEAEELAQRLNIYYRNANIRLAVSEQLLNRLLPTPDAVQEYLNDEVLGTQVFGRSQSITRLKVDLQPDPSRWRLGLEASGWVASETSATKGPVVFYNEGASQFRARKLLLVDRRGIYVRPAEASAQSDSELTGLTTDFDLLPLVGELARAIARQQHDSQAQQARREVKQKVADKASSRLDEEVHRQLFEARDRFQSGVLRPLRKLELDPIAVDMQTTSQRLIVRYRLAGLQQLAAFTPRPQAPGNSLLSLQVHETAINNTLQQLKLEGRRSDLPTLYRELAALFGATEVELPEDLPEDVTIQFADRQAVRVHCIEGSVAVTIRLSELSARRNGPWRNFEVRGYYRPELSGLEARLVRDSHIELIGQRLGLRDQIALRGIFSKTLSRNRPLPIVPARLAEDPRLQDLEVQQFIIDDGWIAVAVGPAPQQASRQRPLPGLY